MPVLLFVEHRIFVGEIERLSPVYDLAIRVVSVLSAEGWPANDAFEHDSSHGPPVASEGVPLAAENLRSNVIRSADS